MESLPESTTILIIGAGPTGLAAAISLIQRGCRDLVIVDALPHGEQTSRAMTLHAATLEALEEIGVAERLVKLGIKGRGMNMRSHSMALLSTRFSALNPYTKYPYVLLIPQSAVERILLEHLETLGSRVLRPLRAIDLEPAPQGHIKVTFDGGRKIGTKYIIGSDGARSTIRQIAGIGFTDPDGLPVYEGVQHMVVADVVFSPLPPQAPLDLVEVTVSTPGVFIMIPLPTSWSNDNSGVGSNDRVHRIFFAVPEGNPPPDLPIEYLQKFVDTSGPPHLWSDPFKNPKPVRISKKVWASRFRTHSSIADTFYTHLNAGTDEYSPLGRSILLLGDVAHIHSPAGDMGMNLGLRDAIGLGRAMAEHFEVALTSEEKAREVLETYAASRREKAIATIRLTKRILGVSDIMRTESYFDLRYWIIRFMAKIPFVTRLGAWRLSGLGNR
ncbi:hypothetical protein HGRIS_013068 [Hohenbuehelia grisea]|uniref:FAD-binding domain-containing protein n=1 Tax=Hohenbuehelia grisea TaxID=104357 RepID=A0ABR3IU92_9AGAR